MNCVESECMRYRDGNHGRIIFYAEKRGTGRYSKSESERDVVASVRFIIL